MSKHLILIFCQSFNNFFDQAKQSIFVKLSVMYKCSLYKHIVIKISLHSNSYSKEIRKIFDNCIDFLPIL